jgi:hypothetical protein
MATARVDPLLDAPDSTRALGARVTSAHLLGQSLIVPRKGGPTSTSDRVMRSGFRAVRSIVTASLRLLRLSDLPRRN